MALGEFLKEIKKNPPSVKFAEMANILVIHCQAAGEQRSVAFPLNQPCYHLPPLLSVSENLYWLEKGACQLWLHMVPVPWGLLSLSHHCLSCFVGSFSPRRPDPADGHVLDEGVHPAGWPGDAALLLGDPDCCPALPLLRRPQEEYPCT